MVKLTGERFDPPFGLGSPHVQSLLSSSALRRRVARGRARDLLESSEEMLVDGGDGVRLLGQYSRQPGDSRGLAVLFHGWEGSAQSNYVLATGARLFADGYDVFRLNFRDHGDSHHLNPGVFHSARLAEVVHGLGDMQRRLNPGSWALAGYSLGGNFALRVAMQAPAAGLNLRRVVAICPVIDPRNVLAAMESGPRFYEYYFVRKWARSMRKKELHWPDRYEYAEWYKLRGLRERTAYFATRYYQYESLEHYLDSYSVGGDRLAGLKVPSTVLTAADDPVVPVGDFKELPESPFLDVHVSAAGGHCGFIRNWRMDSWAEDVISEAFAGEGGAFGQQTTQYG